MTATRSELSDILGAIREVSASLERRRARTYGAVHIMWGLIAGSIFAFYQVVHLDHATYHARWGEALNWIWVVPCAVGVLVTMFIGARVGRMDEGDEERRTLRRFLLVLLPPSAVTVWLLAGPGDFDHIPGLWILFLAFVLHVFPTPRSRALRLGRYAFSAAAALAGLWLLVAPFAWGDLVAALFFGVGQTWIGIVKYVTCD